MRKRLFFAPERTPALTCAVAELERLGICFTDTPGAEVTHLLLPVPCRLNEQALTEILTQLPASVAVLGGFLDRPELTGRRCLDLLKDERYQAENAMITAYCALQVAAPFLPVVWEGCPVLILGWGRIGKCLSRLLKGLGAEVSVAARKETDRAMITALGYDARGFDEPDCTFCRYRVIFNTVPQLVLTRGQTAQCRPACLKIELASRSGMTGDDVIDARGLPGKIAPESSGKLIARTVLRLCARKEEAL